MTVAPVFISSMTTLKSSLRLSGASQPDALTTIDRGVQESRIYIYRILGAARVVAIQSIGYNENGTTDDEISRLKANMCELALVRMYLLRTMPILFMDSSGAKREVWNDEGFTRRAQEKEIALEITRLQMDIDLWLQELAADDGQVGSDVQGACLGGSQGSYYGIGYGYGDNIYGVGP